MSHYAYVSSRRHRCHVPDHLRVCPHLNAGGVAQELTTADNVLFMEGWYFGGGPFEEWAFSDGIPENVDEDDKKVTQTTQNTLTYRDANDFSFSVYENYIKRYGCDPVKTLRFDLHESFDDAQVSDWVDRAILSKLPNCDEYTSSRLWYDKKYTETREQVCKYYYAKECEFALIMMRTEKSGDAKFSIMAGDSTGIALLAMMAEEFKRTVNVFEHGRRDGRDSFAIITRGQGGFSLSHFNVKKHDDSVLEQYNDGFGEVHTRILSSLNDLDRNGLVLLHGIPGTGKTTYLRYLIGKLDKEPIYLPPDMSHHLASPDFVAFLSNHPNSVLLIEDAENILMTRDAGGNQAVSNILNLSDGLLGDALNLQIICTFNTNLTEIDPALLRPGRLIAEYKFDALSKEKTLQLVQKLYGKDVVPTAPSMTLAAIYKMGEKHMVVDSKKRQVGFA